MKAKILVFTLLSIFSSTLYAADTASHAQSVLPYASDQTEESFTKTVHGGVQHVVAKSEDNAAQIKLIQEHLQQRVAQYQKGDFSVTEKIHGKDMPGLAKLKSAETDAVKYQYKALPNGGQIHFASEYPLLVGALHEWFDAQSQQHGALEIPDHKKHHSSTAE